MSFKIDKTLAVYLGPFDKGIDMIILNKVEELLSTQKKTSVRLFNVAYKEVKYTEAKPGYRYFYIHEAYNNRDK